jgi:DNA-binding transcriptional ArsR family regulator
MQGEKEMSPKELSRRLDKPLSNVSYHVRALAKCEAIVLTRTRPARGSEEHFYRVAFDAKWPYEVLGLAPPPDSR